MDIRTAFLQDAARYMAVLDPATSSYLSSERIQLQRQTQKSLDPVSSKQECERRCSACGTIFIPGQNCLIKRGTSRHKGAWDHSMNTGRPPLKYECHTCHQITSLVVPLPQRKQNHRESSKKSGDANDTADLNTSSAVNLPSRQAKLSSKKRAKARQKKLSLQSSLIKNDNA